MLKVAAIIFDFVRDAVNDNAVAGRFAHVRAAKLREFGGHAIFLAKLIDAHDKGRRKAVFTPAKKANFFMKPLLLLEQRPGAEPKPLIDCVGR